MTNNIVIIDFGAQYSQLIARRVRKLGFYSILIPFNTPFEKILSYNPKAFILSGGASSVYSKYPPKCDPLIFTLSIPILGICYGMQLIVNHFQGKIISSSKKEYGLSFVKICEHPQILFQGIKDSSQGMKVWMSHIDYVDEKSLPDGFQKIASTNHGVAAISYVSKKIYGVQFHPEVSHTENGEKILKNFLHKIAQITPNWKMISFIEQEIIRIRQHVGNKKVLLALSGGVDSSVLALLLHHAIKDQLQCVFIDNGFLRLGEANFVVNIFNKHFEIPLKYINAKKLFIKKLRWISDPEKKRRIIGALFVKILKKQSKGFHYLAQGTLYPDIIESVALYGASSKIKTHHNRVKSILKIKSQGKLLEPFSCLFKDEVREIARQLGMPDIIINRQPFPGPGMAVRILGRINRSRLILLKKADFIFQEKIKQHPEYHKFWQSFAVLLPIRSVGVVGDNRSYGYTIALRVVSSEDGMTADFEIIEKKYLSEISNKIIGQVRGITRVVWDITSKPPATIEWE
jgi:GMP synthase (glutamine-hydrolysing)